MLLHSEMPCCCGLVRRRRKTGTKVSLLESGELVWSSKTVGHGADGHRLEHESVAEESQLSTHLEGLPEGIDLYYMMTVVVTRKTMILASLSPVHCFQGTLRHQVFVIRLRNSHKSTLMPNNRATPGVRIEKRVGRKWSGMRVGPWSRALGSRRHVGKPR